MTDDKKISAPWVQSAGDGGDSVQQRIATLFAKFETPPDVDPRRLSRMRARLDAAVQPRTGRRPRVWIWALAALLLLLSSGVVVAARGWVPQWISWTGLASRQPSPAPAVPAARLHKARRIAGGQVPEPASSVALSDAPSAAPPAVVDPQSRPAEAIPPTTPTPPAARAVATGLAARPRQTVAADSEAALLETAVARLRRDRDGAGTLQILDRYDARFSRGALRGEATRLRVDALLLTEDRARALSLLQGLTLSNGARDVELTLIRGELLAAGGDCARALADFDRVSAAAASDPLGDRARVGRADCARRLGEAAAPPR